MNVDMGKTESLREILLEANTHDTCMVLLSNKELNISLPYSSFEMVVATGKEKHIQYSHKINFFDHLKSFCNETNDWIFGHFSYDLKNQVEKLESKNKDEVEFPDGFFFVPQNLILFNNGEKKIIKNSKRNNIINEKGSHSESTSFLNAPKPKARIDTIEYLKLVNKIKDHIHRGDIFEINFCYEYFIENFGIGPVETFLKINELSPMPFAAFYRLNGHYLLCFSPERFIKKKGDKIISQPMKGTIKRGKTPTEDIHLQKMLVKNQKERSENIMITDLVRNDLSRTAETGSVKVEELCGIYEFKQVHQMISTIVSKINKQVHPIDVIKNAFPMGSMTGAPKVRAMELIERYEQTKRGVYSGSIGYFTPEKDFDFNVVIRSIAYNSLKNYLSFMVGSAITSKSSAEKELEECQLKAKAVFEWLVGINN